MRKGSFLVEVLVVIVIVPILMVGLAKLFHTLLTETPRLWKDVQQNSTMLNLVSQIQSDIDKAKSLSQLENPQSEGGLPRPVSNADINDIGSVAGTAGRLLEIVQPGSVVSYEFENKRVVRHAKTGEQEETEERIWQISDAKFEWNVLERDGKGYALEVRNHIEYLKGKRLEIKMANSHLFFTGAL